MAFRSSTIAASSRGKRNTRTIRVIHVFFYRLRTIVVDEGKPIPRIVKVVICHIPIGNFRIISSERPIGRYLANMMKRQDVRRACRRCRDSRRTGGNFLFYFREVLNHFVAKGVRVIARVGGSIGIRMRYDVCGGAFFFCPLCGGHGGVRRVKCVCLRFCEDRFVHAFTPAVGAGSVFRRSAFLPCPS